MLRIAIVSTNRGKFSETFIHHHVKLLPGKIWYLHGGYLPHQFSEGWEGMDQDFLSANSPSWWRKFSAGESKSFSLNEAIFRFLVEKKIQVVLAEYGPSGVEMQEICARAGIPLVVHFHGYDAYRNDMLQYWGSRYPDLFRNASAIIAVSRHMKSQLTNLGAREEKIRLLYYGADRELFGKEKIGHSGPFTFLSLGRFCETKSPHLTLLAFKKVWEEIPDCRLIMAGEGHLLESVRILSRSLGTEHAVKFTGAVPHQDVPALMKTANVFVQHSLTTPENDREGTPVAIIEAAMAGLPIVSTLHAGIPDVITNEEHGFLVPEYDTAAMAAAMIRLAKAPDLAEKMGEKARQHVLSHFSLEKNIAGLYSILRTAAGE